MFKISNSALPAGEAVREPRTRAVLIVDDDVALGRQIATYLTRSGIEAMHERNGHDAIETIRKTRPDVVVMDIEMPGMDGLEAAKIVSAEMPGTRIVLMSGYIEQMQRANAAGIDVFAVVDKPLPLKMLAQFVTNALASSAR